MPRAWNRECRVFVEQQAGVVSCVEIPAVSYWGKRKIAVYGLDDATVRFYPEAGFEEATTMLLNSQGPYVVGDPVEYKRKQDGSGSYIETQHVSGWLVFGWDLPQQPAADVDQLTALYD